MTKKVQRRQRRRHDEAFKREVARAVLNRGDRKIHEVCDELDVGTTQARRWVLQYGDKPEPVAPPEPEQLELTPEGAAGAEEDGPDAEFLSSGLAERMRTLVGVPTEELSPEAPTESKRGRKRPGPQALLPWEPRQVVTVAPETQPAEGDERMLEYLKRSGASAMRERDALAVVLGMVIRDPEAFGGSLKR